MTSSSQYRTNLVSVTGGVVVFFCIMILQGRQGGHADSSCLRRPPSVDKARKTPLRFVKAATEGEISGDEFGILEDVRCIDTLSRARVGVRLQAAPAAAPPDQQYFPDSRRLVCRSRSGSLRAGTPPSHHDHGLGIPSVLALIGEWEALLGPRRFM